MLKCSERRRALVQLSPISLAYRERKLRCMVLTVTSTKQPELRLSEKTSAQLGKSLILMWLSETLLLRHRDVMRGRAVVAEEKEEGDVEEEGKEEAVEEEEEVTVAAVLNPKVLPAQPEATLTRVMLCHSPPFKFKKN
mmetsp:Transcript_4551/g.4698  ORF Transcript_4551/g.4698 Transcript_4551/m.4698 type:complete len:138 (+) Transcript_4551:779-1192(+)